MNESTEWSCVRDLSSDEAKVAAQQGKLDEETLDGESGEITLRAVSQGIMRNQFAIYERGKQK